MRKKEDAAFHDIHDTIVRFLFIYHGVLGAKPLHCLTYVRRNCILNQHFIFKP